VRISVLSVLYSSLRIVTQQLLEAALGCSAAEWDMNAPLVVGDLVPFPRCVLPESKSKQYRLLLSPWPVRQRWAMQEARIEGADVSVDPVFVLCDTGHCHASSRRGQGCMGLVQTIVFKRRSVTGTKQRRDRKRIESGSEYNVYPRLPGHSWYRG
jgi:hypothetical protein